MVQQRLRRAAVDVVNRGKKLVSLVRPYEPMGQGRELLDTQYASSEWDYLRSIGEAPRFGVVSAYCRLLAPKGAILEIGCGEGILLDHLDRDRFSSYSGVDISSVAIERARALESPTTRFFCADAEQFSPDRSFDLIVFNEVLEYFDDPAGLVGRYAPFVADGGRFVVSMFSAPWTARTRHIWRALETRYPLIAHTKVSTSRDYVWNIKVFDPKTPT